MASLRTFWHDRSPYTRLAIVLWGALLLGVGGRVALSKPTSQTVVPIYLAAGQRWLIGQNLYAADSGLDLYRNPPGFAGAFAALTVLPPKLAGLLWRGLSVSVFLLGMVQFRRAVVPDLSQDRAGLMFAVAAVLALPSINNGQVNTLIAGAILHGIAAMARRRWWIAAAWFTLGGWLKLYPFAAGLLACVSSPKSLAPRLLITTALAFAIPFVLNDAGYEAEQYVRFVEQLGADDRTFTTPDRVPRDWTILPRNWLGLVPLPTVTKAVSLLAAISVAGLVGFWNHRMKCSVGVQVLILGSVWMTAFGPATESNTYSLMAAATGYVVAAARSRTVAVLSVSGFLLLAAPVVRAAFPNDWTFHALGPQPLGAILVAWASLGIARDSRRKCRHASLHMQESATHPIDPITGSH